MSIREAIAKVTSREPLGLSDLVDAVQKIGYKFESSNPRNSVGAYLYSKHGKKYFKNVGGKFSSIGAPASAPAAEAPTPSETKEPTKPAKAERQMSAEGRKRIAEAARKMWAERRKAKKK